MTSATTRRTLVESSCTLAGCSVLLAVLVALLSSPPVEANLRLCGPRLTQTIIKICRSQICGGYAVAKRGDSSVINRNLLTNRAHEEEEEEEEDDVQQLSSPRLSLSPWLSVTSHHAAKRSGGGIATECCLKRCSYSYLKTFCCEAPEGGQTPGQASPPRPAAIPAPPPQPVQHVSRPVIEQALAPISRPRLSSSGRRLGNSFNDIEEEEEDEEEDESEENEERR